MADPQTCLDAYILAVRLAENDLDDCLEGQYNPAKRIECWNEFTAKINAALSGYLECMFAANGIPPL